MNRSGERRGVLSIVIPVYNEINTVGELLDRVRCAKLPEGIKKQVIVVDDCSQDGSREFMQKLASMYQVLFQNRNSGKGKKSGGGTVFTPSWRL